MFAFTLTHTPIYRHTQRKASKLICHIINIPLALLPQSTLFIKNGCVTFLQHGRLSKGMRWILFMHDNTYTYLLYDYIYKYICAVKMRNWCAVNANKSTTKWRMACNFKFRCNSDEQHTSYTHIRRAMQEVPRKIAQTCKLTYKCGNYYFDSIFNKSA